MLLNLTTLKLLGKAYKMVKIKRNLVNLVRYESFIIVGIIIALFAFIKVIGVYDFSSDWFWFLAGVGLVVEGFISLIKQRKFDRKYKIIEREEIK